MNPDLKVMCPKCRALPGEPCRSILHDGPLNCRVYTTHKKRRVASYRGDPSTTSPLGAVPVRSPGRSRPQVGPVNSAISDLR